MNSQLIQKEKDRPVRQTLCGVLRRSCNLKCLILTFLIHGCLVAIIWCRNTQVTKILLDFDAFPITRTRQVSPCDDGVVYIPTAFVIMLYLLYLVECWHSRARIQLSLPKTDISTVYRKIQEMREAQPIVWWKAICYHYVRRVRQVTRYRNGGSYTSSQVFYERVNSHAVASYFFYTLCGMRDVSRDIIDLEKYPATKIKFTKGFIFANLPTEAEFEEQRSTFFQEQGRLDDYMEMREALELSNTTFKDSVIAWASPECLPWFAKTNIFWISSFLLLSWPIRILLELNTAHLNYRVTKLFGINYPSNSSLLHPHRPLGVSNYVTTQEGQDVTRPASTPRRPTPSSRLSLTRPTTSNGPQKQSTSSLPGDDDEENWDARSIVFKGQGRRRPLIPRSVTLMMFDPPDKGGRRNSKTNQIRSNFDPGREEEGLIPTYSEALLMNPPGHERSQGQTSSGEGLNLNWLDSRNGTRPFSTAQPNGESHLRESDFGDGRMNGESQAADFDLLTPPESLRRSTGGISSLESPPTYLEALQTSRPVFFPRFTSLRRCLTERDLTGSRSTTRQENERERIRTWLNTTSSYFLQRFSRMRLPIISGSEDLPSVSGSSPGRAETNEEESHV